MPRVMIMVGVWFTCAAVPASTSNCTSARTEGSLASACTFFWSAAERTAATVSQTLPVMPQEFWFWKMASDRLILADARGSGGVARGLTGIGVAVQRELAAHQVRFAGSHVVPEDRRQNGFVEHLAVGTLEVAIQVEAERSGRVADGLGSVHVRTNGQTGQEQDEC